MPLRCLRFPPCGSPPPPEEKEDHHAPGSPLDGYHDEGLETLPWDEKRGFLERRLQRAVLIAFHRAPAMREKLQAARVDPGQIRRLEDLERVPITPKSSLGELQAARLRLSAVSSRSTRANSGAYMYPPGRSTIPRGDKPTSGGSRGSFTMPAFVRAIAF